MHTHRETESPTKGAFFLFAATQEASRYKIITEEIILGHTVRLCDDSLNQNFLQWHITQSDSVSENILLETLICHSIPSSSDTS